MRRLRRTRLRGFALGLAALPAALSGCTTMYFAEPWPCEPYRGDPARVAEFRSMVDRGEYPATRAWVRDADAKCAADRVLVP